MIVGHGECGLESMCIESVVHICKGCHDVGCCGRFDGNGEDVVGVVGISNEEELLTFEGAGR